MDANCIACGHHVAAPLLISAGPLATIAWPESAEDARAMPALPLTFVQCVDCGHIFNTAFDYALVPYADKPNLMFNQGAGWSRFISETVKNLASRLGSEPTVVEIGHGDASFLAALADVVGAGRFVGFDPHGATGGDDRLALRATLFEPAIHLRELAPDLLISRHVLEHLSQPLGFLQRMAFEAAATGQAPLLYLEVPCVDRLIEHRRTVDLYYEHNSHFTTSSFTRMLVRCAAEIDALGHGYDGEVIFGLVRLAGSSEQTARAARAAAYEAGVVTDRGTVAAQLAALVAAGTRVAIWGGTGKSAAFMNHYGVDAERFPIVVDSDAAKVGTYVPGTGQLIRSRDGLLAHPVDVILIPPQWRARDIVDEMRAAGIEARVLIEHAGQLIEFGAKEQPYAG